MSNSTQPPPHPPPQPPISTSSRPLSSTQPFVGKNDINDFQQSISVDQFRTSFHHGSGLREIFTLVMHSQKEEINYKVSPPQLRSFLLSTPTNLVKTPLYQKK